ncbi:hypothetical protein M2419_001512 [Sphingobacterium sp. BIGb0116]|nr:hypothetical protein [Sphingobacterium sp. BIGb0116]
MFRRVANAIQSRVGRFFNRGGSRGNQNTGRAAGGSA